MNAFVFYPTSAMIRKISLFCINTYIHTYINKITNISLAKQYRTIVTLTIALWRLNYINSASYYEDYERFIDLTLQS